MAEQESELPEAVDIEDAHGEAEARPPRPLVVERRPRSTRAPSAAEDEEAARLERVPGSARVYVATFGCAHNVSDSEYLSGSLAAFGYTLVPENERDSADCWLVNSCTVKSPSQSAMDSVLAAGRAQGKALVVAGCVPQGDREAAALQGLSLIGVTQLDRVVEVVEETLRGNVVQLLERKPLPSLDLPKVRRNRWIEILPLSTGCLGACSYCKTVHARGKLGSYSLEALLARARSAIDAGCTELWLSSEDTGAYGRDIGTNLATLLHSLLALLPPDGRTILRLGMANPPYILDQLDEIARALAHPFCMALVHIPVQSGSDAVLSAAAMNREYTVEQFRRCADGLQAAVPGGVTIHTDIIVGFPGESEADFEATMQLVRDYKFAATNISQFYPRPGTAAARMPKLDSKIVKARSRALTALHESYLPYTGLVGTELRAWFTETASDGVNLAGRSKHGVQVIVPPQEGLLGCSATVRVTAAGRWSVIGTVVRVLTSPPGEEVLVHQHPSLPKAEPAAVTEAPPLVELPSFSLAELPSLALGGLRADAQSSALAYAVPAAACFLLAAALWTRRQRC